MLYYDSNNNNGKIQIIDRSFLKIRKINYIYIVTTSIWTRTRNKEIERKEEIKR